MSILRYTDDHEWARLEGDTVTVGITDVCTGPAGRTGICRTAYS